MQESNPFPARIELVVGIHEPAAASLFQCFVSAVRFMDDYTGRACTAPHGFAPCLSQAYSPESRSGPVSSCSLRARLLRLRPCCTSIDGAFPATAAPGPSPGPSSPAPPTASSNSSRQTIRWSGFSRRSEGTGSPGRSCPVTPDQPRPAQGDSRRHPGRPRRHRVGTPVCA